MVEIVVGLYYMADIDKLCSMLVDEYDVEGLMVVPLGRSSDAQLARSSEGQSRQELDTYMQVTLSMDTRMIQ
jgi:hypothetical protein